MKYQPWKGFTLLGIAVVVDVLTGRTGWVTFAAIAAVLFWVQG